ncbi:MAG TPA: helix-turn-helix domain-containing protein [Acidimicrobiales bacterium]|nr:helix-turn-helix domain-containing protein [Acidimicrobiales bacterium]
MTEAWRTMAACRNRTATMFDERRQAEARSLCAGCPVRELCLWACLRDEDPTYRYGMAGGMAPGQRATLARRLPAAVIEAAHDAAVAAWQLRHGLSDAFPAVGGEWHPAGDPFSTPSPTAPQPTSGPAKEADEAIAAVAAAFGIAPEELLGPRRTRRVVDARQVSMYVLRELGLSYPAIGAALGGRDHTTAMHAVAQVRARMAERPALRRGVERLLAGAVCDGEDVRSSDFTPQAGQADVEALLRQVARACGVGPEQLCGPSRARQVVHARHVAMYVLRDVGQLSYPAIGAALGGRDHTTAMRAVERVRCALTQPGLLRERVEAAMAVVTSPVPAAA